MAEFKTSKDLLDQLMRLHPQLIDLSLGRILALLDKLGRPQDRLAPVIHVAGTNGKGSTIAFMQAMLSAAGLRVHTYTSPHLVDFNERIQLAGCGQRSRPISERQLVHYLERVRTTNADAPMSFFEITTAAALLAFSEQPADAVLLEVGLGGRLDATNVVDRPAVTVITPIAIDHADKLGETVGQIAFEKAGILKPGVPAIVAPQDASALTSIAQTANRVGAGLLMFGQHYDFHEERGRLIYRSQRRLIDLPLPNLIGRNQLTNAAVAITALLTFSNGALPVQALEDGLRSAYWPARFSRLSGDPFDRLVGPDTELWLDGGHNPAAAVVLAQTLADLQDRAPKPMFLVVGMMAEKDAVGFFKPFSGLVRGIKVVDIPGEANAMPAGELLNHARTIAIAAEQTATVEQALVDLEREHPGAKRVLICGSLYLAGSVLATSQAFRNRRQ